MSNLVPRGGGQLANLHSGGLSNRDAVALERPTSRQLAQLEAGGLVRATQIDIETRLGQMKMSAASSMARTAHSEIAMMTAMEAELIRAVPLAANRLEMIGNIATIQMAEILADDLTHLRQL